MAKKKPWADTWSFVDELGSGGQGATSLVKSKDGTLGALKILHKQNDPERRARMYLETSSLRVLEHPQIPRLLDTNAEEFKGDAKLYLVTEFIAGGTLGDVVSERKPTLDEAFELTISLCETLAYAHERDIVHRDIKPDNIMLRGNSFSDPVLIDFGMSFNAAVPDEKRTAESQHLGNRFLDLPELKRGPLRRDPRSDVTQLVGALFFAVTGEEPTTLLDHEGQHPHQRADVKQMLDQIEPENRRRQLRRVLDTGFKVHIDRRWQSIQALMSELEPRDQIAEEAPIDVSNLKAEISAALEARDPNYNDRVMLDKANDALMSAVYGPVVTVMRELDRFEPVKFSSKPDYEAMSIRYGAGLRPKHAPDVVFSATFIGRVTGTEIVIFREDGDEEIELIRVPFVLNPDFSALTTELVGFYREGILRQTRSG